MKFYQISLDEGKREKYAYARTYIDLPEDIRTCSMCGRLVDWNYDYYLNNNVESFSIILTNEHFPDYTYCDSYSGLHDVISERCIELLDKEGFNAYTTVKLTTISREEMSEEKIKAFRDSQGLRKAKLISNLKPIYYRILAEIGAELHDDSNRIWRDGCKNCGTGSGYWPKDNDYFAPMFIKSSSWNGNDIFRVKETALTTYCTERFNDFFKDNKLTGIKFDEVEAR